MALWQYNFFVLPREVLENLTLNNKLKLDENDCFDDSLFWKKKQINFNFFTSISKILPLGKSWNKNMLLYGSEDSNCFEILSKNAIVMSVSFRIDFTKDYSYILNELIEFFILNGLVIVDEDLNILTLNFESIKEKIENSPQVKKYKRLSK